MPFDYGPPLPAKPSRELLGEALLDAGRSAEAAEAFRAALKRAPGRRLSLRGLAQAGGRQPVSAPFAPLDDLAAGAVRCGMTSLLPLLLLGALSGHADAQTPAPPTQPAPQTAPRQTSGAAAASGGACDGHRHAHGQHHRWRRAPRARRRGPRVRSARPRGHVACQWSRSVPEPCAAATTVSVSLTRSSSCSNATSRCVPARRRPST